MTYRAAGLILDDPGPEKLAARDKDCALISLANSTLARARLKTTLSNDWVSVVETSEILFSLFPAEALELERDEAL